jgi:hypothetical protein
VIGQEAFALLLPSLVPQQGRSLGLDPCRNGNALLSLVVIGQGAFAPLPWSLILQEVAMRAEIQILNGNALMSLGVIGWPCTATI